MENTSSAHGELLSAIEELRSSNEQLETTQEELRAANEELTAINEELDARNQQLSAVSDDLTNLLSAVDAPILRVDRELRLCLFTPAAEKFFLIGAKDLHQPVRMLQRRLGLSENLEPLIRGAMESLTVQSHKVEDSHNHWWALSIRPYCTADGRMDGAVLTFTNVDSIQLALQASQEALVYADAIVETVREPLVILSPELRVERANASFYVTFGLKPEETQGRYLYELADSQWQIPKLRSLVEEISWTGGFADFEMAHRFPRLGFRVMLLNARHLRLDSRRWILLAFEDITDRRLAEETITNRLERAEQELGRTKEELHALTARLMSAHQEEQRRIARELHDGLVQRLGYLEFQVEQFRLSPIANMPVEVTRMLTGLQRQIAELSDATRGISHGLHPAILDDLGLVAALRKLAREFSRGEPSRVRFVSRMGACALPKGDFAASVYRIAQEALQNASKHAPLASVLMSLHCDDSDLQLTIRDTGPGFDRAAVRGGKGLGIVNIEERARLLGGSIVVESQPGRGTTLTLRAPLPPSPRDEAEKRQQGHAL